MNGEITRTYQENVRNLKDKIQRGDFSLTTSESYLLMNDEEVSAYFLTLVKEEKVDWKPILERLYHAESDYHGFFVELPAVDDVGEQIYKKIAFMFLEICIDNCAFFNLEGLETIFSPEESQALMDKAYQKLINNPKIDKKIFLPNNLVYRLLEEENYEIFMLDCSFARDVDKKYILDKFPFRQYHSACMNQLLSEYVKQTGLNDVIANGLADTVPIEILLNVMADDTKISPSGLSYLVDRILKETDFGDFNGFHFRKMQFDWWDDFISSGPFDEEQAAKIIEHFKQIGRIDLVLGLKNFSIDKGSENYEALLSSMQNGVKLRNIPDNIDEFLQDDTFLKAAVTSGTIVNLFGKRLSPTTKIRIADQIFQEIAKGNRNYINADFRVSDYVKNLDIHQIDFNFYDEAFLNHVAEIQDYSAREAIVGAIIKNDPLFLEKLIDAKQYDIFFKIFYSGYNKMLGELSENSQMQLVEAMKQNYIYIGCLANYLITEPIWHDFIILKALVSFPISRKRMFEVINREENRPYIYSEGVYEAFKEYFVETKGYNAAHLDALKDRFGLKIIKYLEEENIAAILAYDDDKFNRLLDLFSQRKMTIDQLRDAYDSIVQYGFSKEHPEVINIFNQMMISIQKEGDIQYIKLIENQLLPFLDSKFYEVFRERYPNVATQYPKASELLKMIVKKVSANAEDSRSYTDMLHFITDYYIRVERENYRAEHDMEQMASDLNLPYHVDANDAKRKLPKFLVEIGIYQRELERKLMGQGLSLELAHACIDYFVTHTATKDLAMIQKHQKIIGSFLKDKILEMPEQERQYYYNQMNGAKREYDVPETSAELLKILIELKLGHLENVLADDELCKSLKQHLSKSMSIPDSLLDFMAKPPTNIDVNVYNLSAFISYYSEIYKAEKQRLDQVKDMTQDEEKKVSFGSVKIFNLAEAYAAVSSVYSLILGIEDARLIKANPPDNSATKKLANDGRLKEAIEWLKRNYERQEVTVPTFNQTFDVTETKKLQVIVGNFTNPCNLTHGERTGACMRIGGVGEGLFRFCLEDKNGFHIRFQNPETGEYISRVSGFRNGNTVFLNELRYSCNSNSYSNEDIVEACKQAAREIIERSKDSSYPIDNVVLHPAYAAASLPTQDLGVDNVREGLTISYCDIGRNAIVLATSKPDNELVPINFDKRNLPTYLPARDKVVEVHSTKGIVSYIRRIDSVQRLMAGENYEYLEFPIIEENKIKYGFANQDWYVYVDAEGEIHEKIITTDPRAKQEYEDARKLVQAYMPEKGVSTNYVI